MRLKTSFRERKINSSCWSFQQYGPHFLRFRDQNAGGENAEIVESFINFITANTRQTTHPYPHVLWVQARQIEYEYNIFLVKMNRQKEEKKKKKAQILLFPILFRPYWGITAVLDGSGWILFLASLSPHWVAWLDCRWGCWDVPVCSPLKASFFPVRHCGKYIQACGSGVQLQKKKWKQPHCYLWGRSWWVWSHGLNWITFFFFLVLISA